MALPPNRASCRPRAATSRTGAVPGRSLHAFLVLKAAAWLRRKGCVPFSELVTSAGEIPDGFGLSSGGMTILVECKSSRADFLRDAKKFQRRTGLGLGNLRYYMAPAGVIQPDELPPAWGLLEVKGRRAREVVKAKLQPDENMADRQDKRFLFSVLRRLDAEGLLHPSLDLQKARLRAEADISDLERRRRDLRRKKIMLALRMKTAEDKESEVLADGASRA